MNIIANSRLIDRLIALVAFMAGISVPLRASGTATEQAAMGIALVATLIVILKSEKSREWVKLSLKTPEAKVIFVVFIAWTVTLFFSFDPIGSAKMTLRSGVLLLASLLIGSVLYERKNAQALLCKTLILAAITLTFIVILSLNGVPMIVSALKGHVIEHERPIFAFKAYGASVMCMIPVIIWAGNKLGGYWWWAGFVFTPMALAVILLTNNRSALAGFLVMSIVTILLYVFTNRRHVRTLLGTSGALILAAFSWLYIKESVDPENPLYIPPLDSSYLPEWLIDPHRQNIWHFAYERFLDHPWVGNGIDQLNRLPGANSTISELGASMVNERVVLVPSHPHSWAMEILSETGLIGFLPILFALAYIAWRLIKSYTSTKDGGDLARLALLLGFWSSALFNFSIWASWWQLTFFILFAILSSSRKIRI